MPSYIIKQKQKQKNTMKSIATRPCKSTIDLDNYTPTEITTTCWWIEKLHLINSDKTTLLSGTQLA